MAMRISYKPLFSIECLHDYFADRVCRTLALSPTAATARLFRRHHLRFRTSRGGGTVYYDESSTNLLRLSSEPSPLAFALTSTDPLFEIYTDDGGATGGRAPSGTVHYFSNREADVADISGRRRWLLHPPGQPLAQPPLPVRSSRFTYRFDQPVRSVNIEVMGVDGEPAWQTRSPELPAGDCQLDLRGQPCGRYRLVVGGRPAEDFYLSEEPAVRQWGVVDVFLKDVAQAPTYTISFASRATVWRYYIFDQPKMVSPYAGYDIVGVQKRSGRDGSSNEDIRFVRRSETVTVNGRPAFVFESTQTVPLAEVPSEDEYLFTFRPNGGSERGGRPIKLPFAQPTATAFDPAPDGARMVSEIFVYL